jgi:hypothetical protein
MCQPKGVGQLPGSPQPEYQCRNIENQPASGVEPWATSGRIASSVVMVPPSSSIFRRRKLSAPL